jgi:hypothetical protein
MPNKLNQKYTLYRVYLRCLTRLENEFVASEEKKILTNIFRKGLQFD